MCLSLHPPSDPLILACPCFISLRFLKNSIHVAASLRLQAACQAGEVMALKRTAQLIDLSHPNSLHPGAQGVKWTLAGQKSQALTPERRSLAKTSFCSSVRTSAESTHGGERWLWHIYTEHVFDNWTGQPHRSSPNWQGRLPETASACSCRQWRQDRASPALPSQTLLGNRRNKQVPGLYTFQK